MIFDASLPTCNLCNKRMYHERSIAYQCGFALCQACDGKYDDQELKEKFSIPQKINHYYSTEYGTSYPYNQCFYFVNESDLMDHFQFLYKCTANEIEFSDDYKLGLMFTEHDGTIYKQFCDNHNASIIGTICRESVQEILNGFYENSDREVSNLYE